MIIRQSASVLVMVLLLAAVGPVRFATAMEADEAFSSTSAHALRMAQEMLDLPVTVLDCPRPPSAQELGQFYASSALPIGCEAAAGVLVSIEEDGEQVAGSPLTTNADGQVSAQVTVGADVVVLQEASTDPREYEPLVGQVDGITYANPVHLNTVTEGDQWGGCSS